MNEYAIVRLDKPVRGVPGNQMSREDSRRMRYYIRANGWGEAMHKMAERFPGETFYDVAVFENVGPMFREEVKLERKAKSKQETLRRNGARKSKHTDGILVSELQAMMGDACPVGVWA